MVGVFVLLMVLVIPKLAQLYKSMNVELPFTTKVMISVSYFLTQNLLLVGVVTAALVLGIRYFVQTPKGQENLARLMFWLPVFGKINKNKETTQLSRTLGLLLSSAIPIVEALTITSKVLQNPETRQALLLAAKNVEKGNSLSEYFKRYPKIFPPLLGQMASVGEETGQRDGVLGRVGDYYESESDNAVKGLSAALEPIILIMLGGMVGVLIVSIITPIYKITSAIQ